MGKIANPHSRLRTWTYAGSGYLAVGVLLRTANVTSLLWSDQFFPHYSVEYSQGALRESSDLAPLEARGVEPLCCWSVSTRLCSPGVSSLVSL